VALMTRDLTTTTANLPLPAPSETDQIYIRARQWLYGGGTKEERQALASKLGALSRPATMQEIVKHLAILLKALDNGKVDLEVRARVMAEDVGAAEPSIGVLELACTNLRRAPTSIFLPSIGQVLAALAEADKKRGEYLRKFGGTYNKRECNVIWMLPIEPESFL
jgi:hypothetical protein